MAFSELYTFRGSYLMASKAVERVNQQGINRSHTSTLTTEKHYCRKNADSARLEIVRAFQESTPPSVNPPMIDRRERLPGYG